MVKTKQKKRVTADVLTTKKTATKAKQHNPFEVHTNKEKFTVIGRQLKHDRGMPGVSRAKALKRRRDTLGQEYLHKHKANTFRDRRIGESTMTREEAASARFIAERLHQQQGARKESLFNLNDDDMDAIGGADGGDDDRLTHKGQTLGEIEQFQDTVSDDGYDDDEVIGKLDDQYTGAAHFGGGGVDAESRQSAIKDLIADQKRRKEEIGKEREEVSELTHRLDDEWRKLIPLMATMSKEDEKKPKPDAYDRALREMVFEPRGDVGDKLKSEAEVLRAEKERLERLERERLERMAGVTEEDKRLKHRSADDLDDGYFVQPVVAEKPTLAYELDDKTKSKKKKANAESDSDDEALFESATKKARNDADDNDEEQASGDDDDGEEEASSDDDGEEGSDDEDQDEDGDDDDDDDDEDDDEDDDNDSLNDLRATDSESEDAEPVATKSANPFAIVAAAPPPPPAPLSAAERAAMQRAAAAELPYTFELPDTYDELETLLAHRNADYQSVIVERMIKCNHPKVAPENKARMVTLFGYLLQHLNDTFEAASASPAAAVAGFHTLDRLCAHLFDLSAIAPAETTNCFLEVIKEKQQDFRTATVKRYPALDTLIFVKLASSLYSTSDYRHHIVTPCYIFASQLLTRCRIAGRSDIASGLLLVTVLLEYAQLSRRFVPAAINFLAGCICAAVRRRSIEVAPRAVPPFAAGGEHGALLALESNCAAVTAVQLQVGDLVQSPLDDASRVRLLHGALQLARDTLRLLEANVGAAYHVAHIEQHLERLDFEPYPQAVLDTATELRTVMAAIRGKPLLLIAQAAKKPKALRLLEPMFERVYDDKRSRKPGNKDRVVQQGMLRKIKSETRGAIREIRRDNAFIANVQLKQRMAADAERKEKVRRIFSEASIQQGELNAMDRKKKHM